MFTESVSHKQLRMRQYKALAAAFSYPDETFFALYGKVAGEKEKILAEHDRLFRAGEIWLYGAEYSAKNEFQRVRYLADIMGFYRAFGITTDRERPDFLSNELDFMHYLILKELRALENETIAERDEKLFVCRDAQVKFFTEHLYPAAKSIAGKIIVSAEVSFYADVSKEMLGFLEKEKRLLGENR